MKITNKLYDILKWIAQYFLPASGTLYFALAAIWDLPHGEQVVGTISALTIFLGVLLGISSIGYKKDADGTFLVDTTGASKDIYRLQLNVDNIEALAKQKTITLVVDPTAHLSQE